MISSDNLFFIPQPLRLRLLKENGLHYCTSLAVVIRYCVCVCETTSLKGSGEVHPLADTVATEGKIMKLACLKQAKEEGM